MTQFEVFKDGKRKVYEIQDMRVAKALRALDGNPGSQNVFLKIARGFTAVKRIGITLTPDFILRNMVRDYMSANVFSKQGALPFKDVAIAMGDLWKRNDHYYNWLKSGGANGAFLELNSKYLETDIFKVAKETGFIENMQNTLTSAIDVLAFAGNIIESAPRLAEFKRTAKGASSGPAVFEGGFASREITLDFQRMGLKTQALNSIAAFMNAQVQGLDKTARTFKEDPTGLLLRGGALITAPTVMLWALQHDDPRYQEIPQWQRDLAWNIVTDDWQLAQSDEEWNGLPEHLVKDSPDGKLINKGVIVRIPKPQELGLVFATMPERILQLMLTDDPQSGKEMIKTLWETMVPNITPDVGAPPLEQVTNYNLFTGRPLIPHHLEKEVPAYRYTEYTSDSAKVLGKMLGAIPLIQETSIASPIVIENYVRGWTGSMGQYMLRTIDGALTKSGIIKAPETPAWTVADIPFVKAFFVRNPSIQAESIQRFYELSESVTQVMTSTKNQTKKGHWDDVEYLNTFYGEPMAKMDGWRKALSNQGQFIRDVYESDYTQAEKRQLIDTTYYQMIEIAKLANSEMDLMKKTMKDRTKENP
mgnify:CR=1 FL=1